MVTLHLHRWRNSPAMKAALAVWLLASLLTGLHAPQATAAPTIGGCPVLPADNYWNTPVDTLPVHASSALWVNTIGASTGLHADWGNVLSDNYGIPYVTVNGAQQQVPILFSSAGYPDESDPGPFPIPPDAPVEGGAASTGDRHVLVIDTTNCQLYELYRAFPVTGGWQVDSSAKFDLRSNALRPAGWTSADAAGLAIFPGLVRYDEVAAGEINHAIRFTASRIWGRDAATGSPKYLWPARHWSGSSTDPTRPPMGARFRLKASFDISGFDPRTQVILRAFKRYGMVLADAGSNWFFSGVSDTRWPDEVFDDLRSITGSNFEAVETASLMVDPNSARVATTSNTAPGNYQGAWWGGATQNGWGLALTQHGNTLVAGWYHYDIHGQPTWTIMPGCTWSGNACTGNLQNSTGAWLGNYNAAQFVPVTAGTATFTFHTADTATLTYRLQAETGTKEISRLLFGSGVPPSAIDYTDVWSGGVAENGWGVALVQQQGVLVGSWYTYDSQGNPMWYLINGGSWAGAGVYLANLTQATSTWIGNYDASLFAPIPAGTVRFNFTTANSGTMTYSVDGVMQTKSISRLAF